MNLQEIKNKIPRGGIKEIAKRCKLSYVTIVEFFNERKKVSPNTETKILSVTAEYLKQYKEARENAINALKYL